MSATLTACPQKPLPEVAQPTKLSGKVSVLSVSGLETAPEFKKLAWSAGQTPVQLFVLSTNLPKDPQKVSVAQGTISADGNLALTLPASVPTNLLSADAWQAAELLNEELGKNASCDGTKLQVSDKAAQVGVGTLMVGLDTKAPGVILAGPLPVFNTKDLSFNTSGSAGTVVYADRATTVTGALTCTASDIDADGQPIKGKITANVNLHLKQGWNSVMMTGQGNGVWKKSAAGNGLSSGELTVTTESKELPDAWMFVDLGAGEYIPPAPVPARP